ncbi:GtrA family protein [Paraburkholderia sartisoli]|uniref:Putative flippase GtrA (Transmembrane translocase of bactoprenol-linked glucose) n=1 Tax=Paraburkholderia sartisoli TaxID=83784 RepID=A0A1H4CFJ7_9BURK|nr:GtrA family protein [Paraburkholderia sartisoli]SEA58842.1 Putative flippase GtrA (transmembrane translocase of bactoprenol-linked glucose) [Paraburkholderia sartisoli]
MTQRRWLRFCAYVGVGAAGTGVQYVVLFALVSTKLLGAVAASCIGAVFGAIVNYVLNYHLTFRSTGRHAHVAPRFFAVAAAGLAVNSVCMFLLVNDIHLPYLIAQCAATACVLATTYVANSIWAFKTHTA